MMYRQRVQSRLSVRQLICGLSCFVMVILLAANGFSQERLSESEWKRGFHGFNMISSGIGLKPITVSQIRSVPANQLVIVAFGKLRRMPVNIDRMIDNGAAALIATDSADGASLGFTSGIRFQPLNSYETREVDMFAGLADCPIVRDIRLHAVSEGVNEIVTNRPGVLSSRLNNRIAYLPSQNANSQPKAFVAATENRNGGRVVGVADQSVFANQMIVYKDNALFTDQVLKWLKASKRTHVLMIVDGTQYAPLTPADVALHMPSPSQEEVLDALRNLPPSAMLEFANSVATVVEDDGMVNDFIHDSLDKVTDVKLNRFLMFLMFSVVCLSFVVGFLWQKKLMRQTASEVATKQSQQQLKRRKSIQTRERQWAAHVLLDSICVELANRRYNDWPGFPLGLNFGEDKESKSVFKTMTKMSNLFKSKPDSYWSRSRLRQLERDTDQWRQFFKLRQDLGQPSGRDSDDDETDGGNRPTINAKVSADESP